MLVPLLSIISTTVFFADSIPWIDDGQGTAGNNAREHEWEREMDFGHNNGM